MSNMIHFTLRLGDKVRVKVEGRIGDVFVGYPDRGQTFEKANTSEKQGHEESFLPSREIIIDPELVGELEKSL